MLLYLHLALSLNDRYFSIHWLLVIFLIYSQFSTEEKRKGNIIKVTPKMIKVSSCYNNQTYFYINKQSHAFIVLHEEFCVFVSHRN